MTKKSIVDPLPNYTQASLATYLSGFVLSLALTIAPFALVIAYDISDGELLSRNLVIAFVALFAVVQLAVQSMFFLHLSGRRELRPTIYSTIFTLATVLTIVIGSLWVMNNLNYQMSHDEGTLQSTQEKENIDSQHTAGDEHSSGNE